MSAADQRDTAHARLELTIQKQLSLIWGRAIEAARLPEAGGITDADGLAAYQQDRDRAIAKAARTILSRADAWAGRFTTTGGSA